MVKELLPIVLACTVWGQEWASSCMCCLCDNLEVVACLRSHTSQDRHCMHMLRTLAFVEARHTFSLQPQYISTTDHHLAACPEISLHLFSPRRTPGQRTYQPSWWICSWTPRLTTLAPAVQRYSAMKKFTVFCSRYNVFTVTEYFLCCFTTFLATKALPHSQLSPTCQRFVTHNCH